MKLELFKVQTDVSGRNILVCNESKSKFWQGPLSKKDRLALGLKKFDKVFMMGHESGGKTHLAPSADFNRKDSF